MSYRILLNTTFVVHASIQQDFLHWIADVYLPSAAASGLFGHPQIARVLTRIEPHTDSFAVQLPSRSQTEAASWHDTTAAALRNSLQARWGERLMHFTTYMEVLDPDNL